MRNWHLTNPLLLTSHCAAVLSVSKTPNLCLFRRVLFNWAHRGIGLMALALAGIDNYWRSITFPLTYFMGTVGFSPNEKFTRWPTFMMIRRERERNWQNSKFRLFVVNSFNEWLGKSRVKECVCLILLFCASVSFPQIKQNKRSGRWSQVG